MFAKRLAYSLASAFVAILMSGLLWVVQAQTSYLNVSVERDQAHFAIKSEARQMRIEVYSPGGELIFDSGEVAGQTVVWNLLDQQGQPVTDGVYLATLSISAGPGETLKRIEQVTVARGAQLEQQPNVMAAAAPNAPKVEGSGTPGRIPKWTDVTQIGDSVISEAANKIGIGQPGPTASLHVTGAQPAASSGNGANGATLLQLSGGKGGNTTGAGATAGAGADVSLLAGNGGDAPAGSANGRGGSITLQPGSPGAGAGAAGQAGNVLLAPFGGNVGVGAASPGSKLTVDGSIQMTGGGSGLKFPDNTIQSTAAVSGLAAVAHNATLSGDGTGGSPLGVANQAVGNAQLADGAVSSMKIAAGQVVKSLNGLTDDLTLAAGSNVTITPSGNTLTIAATGSGSTPVSHNATLSGDGTSGNPLSVAAPLSLTGSSASPILSVTNSGSVVAINAAGAIDTSTHYNIGGRRVLSIPGVGNTFLGVDTGQTGIANAFFGYQAGLNNINGETNAFFGFNAGNSNTNGSNNSFFGYGAGRDNTVGTTNAFFGYQAGLNNGNGSDNSFFGRQAGQNNTFGVVNSFFGANAGLSNTTENYNTFIAANANGAADITNATALGANASVTQSNSLVLGSINGVNGAGADVSVGIGTTAPKARLHVQGSNVFVGSAGQGIILKSPNGATCRLLRIDNDGSLQLIAVACP